LNYRHVKHGIIKVVKVDNLVFFRGLAEWLKPLNDVDLLLLSHLKVFLQLVPLLLALTSLALTVKNTLEAIKLL